ncbi:MAG: serine/threonine protein kinase [Granulosicoccus sp.]
MTLINHSQARAAGYELMSPAILGGTSTVYKARPVNGCGTPIALKIVHPSHDSACIVREANVLRSLQHPHIARFVESGIINEHAYLATAWVDGIQLKGLIDDDVLTIERALNIARQLASALHYAHQHKVTHGDLSPSNIMIFDIDQAVLLDFGIGRFASESTVTDSGDLAGTPRYLAPELIKGEPPSPASDQYALAILLYEMLTGRWPFAQKSGSAAAMLHHQLYSTPIPLREFRPDSSAKLEKVLGRALEKNPEKRFDTVHAFSVELGASVVNNEPMFRTHKHAVSTAVALLCIGTISAGLWYAKPMQTHLVAHAAQDTALLCNMYNNADFSSELEQNFYRDKDNDQLARRIERSDLNSSPVIQIGDNSVYGLYGVIIPIEPGSSFNFSADFWFEGHVPQAQLRVVWLDIDWQVIEGADSEFEIPEKTDGRYMFGDVSPPAQARYAVPSLFKDASRGIAFADNIEFSSGKESNDC